MSAKIGLASWWRTAVNGAVMAAGMALLWWWQHPADCDAGNLVVLTSANACRNAPWVLICYAIVSRGTLLIGEIAFDEISRRRAAKRKAQQ